MAAANQGEVEIELGGGKYVLRPTLQAAKTVNKVFGGFDAAFRELMALNLDAYVAVIAAGLGKTANQFLVPEDEKKLTVEQAVYEQGIETLSGVAAKFVGFLTNGGRDPNEKKDATPGEA